MHVGKCQKSLNKVDCLQLQAVLDLSISNDWDLLFMIKKLINIMRYPIRIHITYQWFEGWTFYGQDSYE
ncbi:MAG: hypothetical protein A2381_10225 [Bdellovibrionales bacterium RIFOXYB1_FULL_37_110]|nr:MAG: hypothetical protein A2417_02740 [Bdellovibrionales bacterium RIFOXYC1_FULL_37_79]OFZ61141.1 MAG: hypothetical protein A2381_10225 [Bdellovibrionales bacterium RIFOXYB1_FULL_37_110]OFZ65592.1 MAG: hypothetical protein A2577_02410 [Bdellovibrionales bacterium RIFOXYD1_FULL_36_51]